MIAAKLALSLCFCAACIGLDQAVYDPTSATGPTYSSPHRSTAERVMLREVGERREAIARAQELEAMRAQLAALQAQRRELEDHAERLRRISRGQSPATREQILYCIRDHEGDPNGYTTNTGNDYYGAYQMDSDFWASYGDGSAPNAAEASPQAQDDAAWRGYQARGYGPWPPAQGKCP